MQRALIRHVNDFYEEYIFSYGEYRGYNAYDSTEKLLAHSGYSPDLIKLICGKYASWVLVIGDLRDAVFYGRAANSGILAYGDYGTILDWVTDTQGFLSIRHAPMSYRDLLRNNSVNTSLAFLRDLGIKPRISPDDTLQSIETDQGSEYWVRILP
jgi:hypothetical protein